MVAIVGSMAAQVGIGLSGKAHEDGMSKLSSSSEGQHRAQARGFNPFDPPGLSGGGQRRQDPFNFFGGSVSRFPCSPVPHQWLPRPCPYPALVKPPVCGGSAQGPDPAQSRPGTCPEPAGPEPAGPKPAGPKPAVPEQSPGACRPVVVNTGYANDSVNIHQHADGRVDVTVNGETTHYTSLQAKGMVINTGAGNDTVTVTGTPPADGEGITIRGGRGNDTITGGAGADHINGGSGNDTINSRGGDDYVNAGSGNDVVNSGRGNDTVYGGSGRDYISSGAGNDTVYAGAGNDTVRAGSGNDTVYGGSGHDGIFLGTGNDTGFGNQGNDNIYGGHGNDTLNGGAGWDMQYGGRRHDTVEDRDNIWLRKPVFNFGP